VLEVPESASRNADFTLLPSASLAVKHAIDSSDGGNIGVKMRVAIEMSMKSY